MNDIANLDATSVVELMQSGLVSAPEVVSAALDRANAAEDLGMTTVLFGERAIEKARTASGPFAGVPILLKDAGQELAGTSYWAGTSALKQVDYKSRVTTLLVEQLEALGFIVIGKASVSELMTRISTEPPTGPPVRNPWDPTRTSGGSSGGSAAAVAAGLVPVAHGSDSTGSLRYPASCCAVHTLKPTAGRIESRLPGGIPNPSNSHTDFVLARSVRDLRALLGHLSAWAGSPPRGRKVGLLTRMPFGLGVDSLTQQALSRTADDLDSEGWEVVDMDPNFLESYGSVLAATVPVLIDANRALVVDWVEQQLGRSASTDDLAESILEAASRGNAQGAEESGDAWEQVLAAAELASSWTEDADALMMPIMDRAPWLIGSPEPDGALGGLLCSLANFSGQPSAVIPTIQDGIPIGLQLQGPVNSDEWLLEMVEGVCASAPNPSDWAR